MLRAALNGLGRIDRAALKILMETPGFELVAVNDIGVRENLAYLIQDVVRVTTNPIVSSDIRGDTHAAVVALDPGQVMGGDLAKVMCWYDNQWGFTNRMVRMARKLLHMDGAVNALEQVS